MRKILHKYVVEVAYDVPYTQRVEITATDPATAIRAAFAEAGENPDGFESCVEASSDSYAASIRLAGTDHNIPVPPDLAGSLTPPEDIYPSRDHWAVERLRADLRRVTDLAESLIEGSAPRKGRTVDDANIGKEQAS